MLPYVNGIYYLIYPCYGNNLKALDNKEILSLKLSEW